MYKVLGFGACMISGFPLKSVDGFYELGLKDFVRQEVVDSDSLTRVISLPSFSLPRAEKYVKKRVLGNADIVVLQFASTDALCRVSGKGGTSSAENDLVLVKNLKRPAVADRIRWFLKGVTSYFLKSQPITKIDDYSEALKRVIDLLNSNNISVVVIGPFVNGNFYSNRSAKKFSLRIRSILDGNKNAYFVDGHHILARKSIGDVLLADGFHLSKYGHALIAKELFLGIQSLVELQKNIIQK